MQNVQIRSREDMMDKKYDVTTTKMYEETRCDDTKFLIGQFVDECKQTKSCIQIQINSKNRFAFKHLKK